MVTAAFHLRSQALWRCVTACLVYAAGPAWATDASGWEHSKHSAARLLAAGYSDDQRQFYRAGIEVQLAPGWKTYWRYPGDSGMPPRFDFSASQNLERAEVLWPAPSRFPDAAGFSIGYKNAVVFPLRLWPRDKTQPIQLNVAFEYAICEKVCIPVEAKLMIDVARNAGAYEPILAAAEARVPQRVALGDGAPLAIRSVKIMRSNPPKIMITVTAEREAKVDLFAEAPRGDWSAPLPETTNHSGETRLFTCTVDSLPAHAYAEGAAWTFTATSGAAAIEVYVPLD